MAIKNTLTDLNNHLFAEMERLNDEDLKGDELDKEIERARAITCVATQIIANGSLALRAEQFKSDVISATEARVPAFLEARND